MSDDLDNDIDEKSSKKKYLTWTIIAIVIVAVIAVPLVLMRQSEPTEATEPTTIEQLENEIDALYVTVYGTDEAEGLETKLAKHAEAIADFQAGDCVCPDYSGQIQDINNDLILLRTDLNAVPDCTSNITQLNAGLDDLSADLTAVETTLMELEVRVEDIVVTDWSSDISDLELELADVIGDITTLDGEIAGLEIAVGDLQTDVEFLLTSLPRYAVVKSMGLVMGGRRLEVEVRGAGYFPVIVTLYGQDLDPITIWDVDSVGYIIESMPYAQGKILAIFIHPVPSWDEVNTILLDITGSISYASASVGV